VKSRSLARYEIAPITMTADYTFIIYPCLDVLGHESEIAYFLFLQEQIKGIIIKVTFITSI
jgi:hypothetical protein